MALAWPVVMSRLACPGRSSASSAWSRSTVWTRRRVSASRRSVSIRSASSSPSTCSTRRVLVRTATTAIECASWASVLRLWPVSKSRTRAASLAGTSTTCSPASRSRCASGRPAPLAALDRPDPVRPGLRVLPHRGVAGPVGGEPTRPEQLLVLVDDLDRGRQLVGIDPDDDLLHVLLPPVLVPMWTARWALLLRAGQSLLEPRLVTVTGGPQTDSEPHPNSRWAAAWRAARRSPGPSLARHRSYGNRLVAAQWALQSARAWRTASRGAAWTRVSDSPERRRSRSGSTANPGDNRQGRLTRWGSTHGGRSRPGRARSRPGRHRGSRRGPRTQGAARRARRRGSTRCARGGASPIPLQARSPPGRPRAAAARRPAARFMPGVGSVEVRSAGVKTRTGRGSSRS